MYKLRYYQQEAVDAIYAYFRTHPEGNPIVAAPTGVGKSLIIADFIVGVVKTYPKQRVMMLTHVKELIEQNFEKLISMWPMAPAGIYSAGLNRKDTHQSIIFAGIQSVAKRPEEFGHIDLIIIDEAHLVSPKDETNYFQFIAALKRINPQLKVIGLTATPYRLGLGLLTEGNIFDDICYDCTILKKFNRLVTEGFIMPLVARPMATEIDISEVKKSGGEFVLSQLQKAVDKEAITYACMEEILAYGEDRTHWMIFGTGTEHCDHIADMLESFGISAVSVHSKKSAAENKRAINSFKAGTVTALVNNNKLTTGFDCPEVDLIAVLRHTMSPGLWVQILGRGTRPVYAPGFDLTTKSGRLASIEAGPKQDCLVLDFAGNTARLGPINDPLLPRKKGEGGGGVAPVKTCPTEDDDGNQLGCGAYNHCSARFCMECGYEFPQGVNFYAQASSAALMVGSEPEFEHYDVTKVIYTIHRKMDRPDSILATYYIGLAKRYKDWVCLEHSGFAGKKAREWWLSRTDDEEAPTTTAEGLKNLHKIRSPKTIRVWVNKKYPEITGYDFGEGYDN